MMTSPQNFLRVAVPAPLYRCFDYLPPVDCNVANLKPGIRVRVPFGKREMVAILMAVTPTTTMTAKQLKQAIEILDVVPVVSTKLMELVQFASDYYHHPLGDVLASALPALLRKGKIATWRKSATTTIDLAEATPNLQLNDMQQAAVSAVTAALKRFQTFLLHGVTGSGKTEVYLQIIETVLHAQQQALVLVPEIGLTPQTVARFRERFKVPIAVLHSGLTERERLDAWLQAKEGSIPIIIGTRSAVFTPLLNPGIIIVDEEHDMSFKQQKGFRYCARDLAIVRGRLEAVPVVLGSATPSLESFYNAQQKRYQLLSLPARAGNAVQPQFCLADLRNQKLDNGLSTQLITTIERHLQQNGQILLFLNRRGFAPVLLCHSCGWIASCKRCDVKLAFHQHPPALLCHHCGATQKVDQTCPACQSQQLLPLGLGTQRLEQTLAKHFPTVGIARIDRDSTRGKGTLQDILDTIHNGENRILIGTQMLAKGHHFPDVTLVAILDADSGLFSADFRASEHIAQLLLQVAGRAGRAERPGEVLIQTHNPEHPLLLQMIQQNYTGFVDVALTERQAAELPPYAHLAMLRAEAHTKEAPLDFLTQVRELAKKFIKAEVAILGPVPTLIARRAGYHRAQLLLQTTKRAHLHKLLAVILEQIEQLPLTRKVRWSIDVDPREMM